MADATVLVAKADGVTRLTLNRPGKLNALNKQLYEEMMSALAAAEVEPACRVVVLTGAGRAFCAGQDLTSEVYDKAGPPRDLGVVVERYNGMIERMRRLGKPIIGAVNGIAAGGGASLALACDIVIAKKSASFLQAFAPSLLWFFAGRIIGGVTGAN